MAERKITFNGITKTMREWGDDIGVSHERRSSMFIEVTLPHGTAYLRADRIESVMPIAHSEIDRVTGNNPDSHIHRTMIDMLGSPEGESWWVAEDVDTIMDRIHAEIRDMCQLTFQGVNSRTIERMENQIITLLNRTSGNVPRDGG